MNQRIKLSKWAKLQGVTYQTAFNWFNQGKIPNAIQLDTGSIFVEIHEQTKNKDIVIYARVSNQNRKSEMEYQVERISNYCNAKGYNVCKIYKEVASGMNDNRKQLWNMLSSNPAIIVIENKDRLTRFGFNYLQRLLEKLGTKIEVINVNDNDEQDLIKDMISIVTSFCCRLYGLRRAKNKRDKIIQVINEDN